MEFYEPTFLFRQNAIRRVSPEDCPVFSYNSNNSSSWLLNNSIANDAPIMNKVCSLDRVNIKSNYWKIPDTDMNLTALATSNPTADSPLVAISSANTTNNLFVYELDALNHYLTHHTTITLPNIHSLAWVPNTQSKFLVSGNNKGYAHLLSVPRPSHYGEDDDCAEIIKRFNHRKHLRRVNKDTSLSAHAKTCISELGFLSDSRLATCYDDTLFIWNMNVVESSMRPTPESIQLVSGINSFDCFPNTSSTLALCGAFGVSLFDIRTSHHSIPESSLRRNNFKNISANLVKWHASNENILASAHNDGVVRLWDIRKQDTFAEISGHKNKTITSMSWHQNDLFTGASDGNIVHWDLTSNLDQETELSHHGEKLQSCSLREGIQSVSFDSISNTLMQKVNERQCGTLLPASNNQIIGMATVGDAANCKVLSIDGAAFLGLHSKIYEAAGSASVEKEFYTEEDLSLIMAENSTSTLVGSSVSLIKPLNLRKKAEERGSTEQEEINVDSTDSTDKDTELGGLQIIGFGENLSSAYADEISVATEDFDFTQDVASDFTQDVVSDFAQDIASMSPESLHSIDSMPGNLGMSDASYNDSAYTLSTVATVIETDQTQKGDCKIQRDDSAYLDAELDEICRHLPVFGV